MNNTTSLLDRVITYAKVMPRCRTNLVIFDNNVPWIWLQYYLGLTFNKPTFILIENKHLGADFLCMFDNPLVKRIYWIEKFSKSEVNRIADAVAKFVEEQKL